MKMLLSAPAIAKLIELDPDGTVELARGAATQVAEELAKKIVTKITENAISTRANTLSGANSKWSSILSIEAQKLIQEGVKAKVDAAFSMKTNPALMDEMRLTARALITAEETRILRELSDKIDVMIKQRFAAAFGAAQ